jgi:polysaccharide biosynthesis protein PslH
LRDWLKRWIFRLLGKDPEAVVVCFASGAPDLVEAMLIEMRALTPDRHQIVIRLEDLPAASVLGMYSQIGRRLGRQRIGLAPVCFDGDRRYRSLRIAAWLHAPAKILAFNRRLERHHLRLRTILASWLFLRGVPLDRIFLRPRWLVPWKKDRSVYPQDIQERSGRALSGLPAVAVLTPYFPYPLAHGGAVRIYNLLREMATEFDIFLFAFRDRETDADLEPLLAFCARVVLAGKPRYREPRWSTLLPPEVHEFRSQPLRAALERVRRDHQVRLLQVEYTFLAPYHGDVLVEHDVTFSLYRQVWERTRSLSAWWDYWRWRRFETRWLGEYRAVTVVSEQDRTLLHAPNVHVIPNGVDLERFTPHPEHAERSLLFIGSFRHFPNIVAFRFFHDEVWPRLSNATLTVVAGDDPLFHWSHYTGQRELPSGEGIRLLGFTADVRPLYADATVVLVPTLESAGTNLKVLEALAMRRAVVSTNTGCQGLGLTHGTNVWIADTADGFAEGVNRLLEDSSLRLSLAEAGWYHVQRFGWKEIGTLQKKLLRSLTAAAEVVLRPMKPADLPRLLEIERAAFRAPQWNGDDFTRFDCDVALMNQALAGFLVSRQLVPGEREILNVAVHPEYLRRGIAQKLIRAALEKWPGMHFLEVRESNSGARQLYQQLGFEQVGQRPEYYDNPPETGIVMRIFS